MTDTPINVADASAPPPLARRLRDWLLGGEGMLYLAFVVLVVVFSVASPVFLSLGNLENVGRQTALVTIVAVGMTFVIVSGEFDLSVGSVMALSGVMAATAMQSVAGHWLVGAVAALATGATFGLVNGVIEVLGIQDSEKAAVGLPLDLMNAAHA